MVVFYIALAIFTVSLLVILAMVKRSLKKQEEEFNRRVKEEGFNQREQNE